jgi:hypothetical protein
LDYHADEDDKWLVAASGTGIWHRHLAPAFGTGIWHRHLAPAFGRDNSNQGVL